MTTDTPPVSTELEAIEAEVATHAHGRVPRDLRRRQIVAAAEQLFAERGFAAASMDELAARVGVSKPVVYDLVGGKDAVFEACMARAADTLAVAVAAAVADAGDDDAGRLRAGALAWFRFIEERRDVWFALIAADDAPATAAIDAIRARQDRFVALQLAEGARSAGADVDDDMVEAVAAAMNGAFEALGRWWHDHRDRSAEELADLYTALVLPGLTQLLEWAD